MMLNPAIIALLLGSALVCAYAAYASITGIQILRWWDMESGSEQQLMLERKTYLVSTILSFVLAFELFSLLLFIHTADSIHGLFVGAMCAAGSLNVNDYGYPTLVLKIVNFFLCGIWMVMNHTDNKGYDYPLIRAKYKLLLALTALLALEGLLQASYFAEMEPDVITSCCGTLFSEDAQGFAADMAAIPPYTAKILLFSGMLLLLRIGLHACITGEGARLYSLLAGSMTALSVAAVVSVICLYYYELPTHHCPFCLLQKEYDYVGYPLYLTLFIGGILGTSAGVISGFRGCASLKSVIPGLQKRLCLVSMIAFLIFSMVAAYPMVFSDFVPDSRMAPAPKTGDRPTF